MKALFFAKSTACYVSEHPSQLLPLGCDEPGAEIIVDVNHRTNMCSSSSVRLIETLNSETDGKIRDLGNLVVKNHETSSADLALAERTAGKFVDFHGVRARILLRDAA